MSIARQNCQELQVVDELARRCWLSLFPEYLQATLSVRCCWKRRVPIMLEIYRLLCNKGPLLSGSGVLSIPAEPCST
jgi:hypothetical protein